MLLAITCVAGLSAYSQSFTHGVGSSLFLDKPKDQDMGVSAGLTYAPRFNFLERDEMSLSIGVPMTVGFSGSIGGGSVSSGDRDPLSLMLDAPLILNLNLGCGSSLESERGFGFFVGGGFGYHYGAVNDSRKDEYGISYNDKKKGSTMGPAGNVGVRFSVGAEAQSAEVKLGYMKGMNDSKLQIYSLTLLYNF